jgi:hypothetical protein
MFSVGPAGSQELSPSKRTKADKIKLKRKFIMHII